MRKGRRKPLDACLLNQKLLLFFQSNFPVVFPCEPTFWYCRRADGKGSDLLWAVVDRKESNSRFLPKSTLHVGSPALLCPGLLFPLFREEQKTSKLGGAAGVHSKLAKRISGMSRVGRGGATHCTAIWGHGSCWQISNPNNNYTEPPRDRRIES